jgi:uncharacterized membrane protein YraQ (UPF0718 family)
MKLLKRWEQSFMLFIAAGLYLFLLIFYPARAGAALVRSFHEMENLLLPITLAMFFGGSINLVIKNNVSCKIFQGKRSILSAGITGSIFPPCPFISYPLIKGFHNGGVKLPVIMTMIIATTLVEITQLFAGLAVFGAKIVALRIGFAFTATIVVGFSFSYVYSLLSSEVAAESR